MKSIRTLLLLVGLAAVFAFTGCDKTNNALFETTKVDGGVVQADSISVDGKLVTVTPEMRAYIDPARIVKAGTQLTQEKVSVTPAAQAVVNAVKYAPVPGADILSMAVNGVLGIATVWLTRSKLQASQRASVAEATNVSLVKGVDTFRDILDQTEGGGALDDLLVGALKTQTKAAGVKAVVDLLVEKYATPEKPKASALTADALAKAS